MKNQVNLEDGNFSKRFFHSPKTFGQLLCRRNLMQVLYWYRGMSSGFVKLGCPRSAVPGQQRVSSWRDYGSKALV